MTNTRTDTMAVTSPTGERWTVTYRPGVQRKRTGLGNSSGVAASRYVAAILRGYGDDMGTVRCAACGVRCGVGRGVVVDGFAIAAVEADRAVGDLPGWTFGGPSVPYCEATVIPVCPLHNGDSGARAALDTAQREALDTAARAALDAHAERVP